MNCIYTI
jgi:hypothetical protein